MAGWLYTDSLVFFCLPLFICYDYGVPRMPIAFLLEEEEFWDNETPPLGQLTKFCFPYYIA